MNRSTLLATTGLALTLWIGADATEAWARVRGFGGGRGSRSYSAPARPTSPSRTPSSPSQSLSESTPAGAPATPSSLATPASTRFMRNALSGAAGFFAGGLLGRLLFGGFGYGGYQSPFGFGFLELLLVGLGAYFLLRFVRSHQPVPALAGASATAVGAAPVAMAVPVRPAGASDVSVGVGHIRQADPRFNVEALADQARAMYSCVQAGLAMRDMGMIRNRLTPEAYVALQAQCDQLRAARRSNHVEKIDIERAELTEAWQEGGRDYVTVYLAGSLLDYTTEDASPDRVVEGSKDEAQRFEEFWTYTRPSGANPWRLSAIQTG